VAPYAIVAGVPAREVGQRFSEHEIDAHEVALYGMRLTPASDFGTAAPAGDGAERSHVVHAS
jgi:hypothetical protein